MPSFLEDSAVFKSCITKLHDPLFDQLSKIPNPINATVPIPKTVGSAIHHKRRSQGTPISGAILSIVETPLDGTSQMI